MRKTRATVMLAFTATWMACNGSDGAHAPSQSGATSPSAGGNRQSVVGANGGEFVRPPSPSGGAVSGREGSGNVSGSASGGATNHHGGNGTSPASASGGSTDERQANGGSPSAAGSSSAVSTNPSAIVVSADRSLGCGKLPPPPTTARQSLDVNGTKREYIVVYPQSYDPNHAYRALYEFHGSGGDADENVGFHWYGVEPLSGGSVIFVAPQGLGTPSGWPNVNGQDMAFIRKLIETIGDSLCVDTSRIFATGFSFGGSFVNTLGCQLGTTFRAIAPASSGGPRGTCVGKVAAILIHGDADATVNISRGLASRDYWLNANHCATSTVPIAPAPCVAYQGCDAGYPVAWCEHNQGHVILPEFFGPAIWNFISQF